MEMIADILMAAGAFGAAVYCYILAQRLKKFQTLESGMGGAIAVLSAQVDDMTRALEKARGAATGQANALEELTRRGESVAARLEITLASMHDLPDPNPNFVRSEPAAEAETSEKRLRFVRRRVARDDLEAAE
jgi:hypothetical protein